ncbi:hypothetical protein ACFTWN_32830 [Streptomyces sp. NPDC057092]|uniref:hypothetical protein n=1 Tax=Streptomyces sp. NPDC057092 TaxID=3346017 RepID=UPI0036332086
MTHRGNTAGIHDALVGLADELRRRNDLAADQLADVPRLIVAMDSANGMMTDADVVNWLTAPDDHES